MARAARISEAVLKSAFLRSLEVLSQNNSDGVSQIDLITHVAETFGRSVVAFQPRARFVLGGMVRTRLLRKTILRKLGGPVFYHVGDAPWDSSIEIVSLKSKQSKRTVKGADVAEELSDDMGNVLSIYFKEMRHFKVQKRVKEIEWFTELDALYRKLIAYMRASRAWHTLLTGSVVEIVENLEDDEDAPEKNFKWLYLWWRDRNWREIDRSVFILEVALKDASREESEQEELLRVRHAVSPVFERSRELRQEIVSHNLGLVVTVAKPYMGQSVGDVIQEGNIGLMRAADKFFLKKGWKFSTYAVWWIRSVMGRYLGTYRNIIRLPAHMSDLVGRMYKFEESYYVQNGRYPLPKEIASGLEVNLGSIENLFFLRGGEVSLSRSLRPGDDVGMLIDLLSSNTDDPEKMSSDRKMSILIAEVFARFTPRDRLIMELRFGLAGRKEHTLEETGRALPEYGYEAVSRERIRQIERQMLRRIGDGSMAARLLAEYRS